MSFLEVFFFFAFLSYDKPWLGLLVLLLYLLFLCWATFLLKSDNCFFVAVKRKFFALLFVMIGYLVVLGIDLIRGGPIYVPVDTLVFPILAGVGALILILIAAGIQALLNSRLIVLVSIPLVLAGTQLVYVWLLRVPFELIGVRGQSYMEPYLAICAILTFVALLTSLVSLLTASRWKA